MRHHQSDNAPRRAAAFARLEAKALGAAALSRASDLHRRAALPNLTDAIALSAMQAPRFSQRIGARLGRAYGLADIAPETLTPPLRRLLRMSAQRFDRYLHRVGVAWLARDVLAAFDQRLIGALSAQCGEDARGLALRFRAVAQTGTHAGDQDLTEAVWFEGLACVQAYIRGAPPAIAGRLALNFPSLLGDGANEEEARLIARAAAANAVAMELAEA